MHFLIDQSLTLKMSFSTGPSRLFAGCYYTFRRPCFGIITELFSISVPGQWQILNGPVCGDHRWASVQGQQEQPIQGPVIHAKSPALGWRGWKSLKRTEETTWGICHGLIIWAWRGALFWLSLHYCRVPCSMEKKKTLFSNFALMCLNIFQNKGVLIRLLKKIFIVAHLYNCLDEAFL